MAQLFQPNHSTYRALKDARPFPNNMATMLTSYSTHSSSHRAQVHAPRTDQARTYLQYLVGHSQHKPWRPRASHGARLRPPRRRPRPAKSSRRVLLPVGPLLLAVAAPRRSANVKPRPQAAAAPAPPPLAPLGCPQQQRPRASRAPISSLDYPRRSPSSQPAAAGAAPWLWMAGGTGWWTRQAKSPRQSVSVA